MSPDDIAARDGGAEAEWMRRMADGPVDGPPLPDPYVLWWKAGSLRRLDAARRYAVADGLPIAVAAVAAMGLLVFVSAPLQLAWRSPAVALPVLLSVAAVVAGVLMAGRALFRHDGRISMSANEERQE